MTTKRSVTSFRILMFSLAFFGCWLLAHLRASSVDTISQDSKTLSFSEWLYGTSDVRAAKAADCQSAFTAWAKLPDGPRKIDELKAYQKIYGSLNFHARCVGVTHSNADLIQ